MNRLNNLPLMTLAILLFTLVGCGPNTNPTAYPNPATVTSLTPIATPLPITPTSTFAKKWEENTPKPMSTRANFEIDHLAFLSSKDALDYSDEELFEVLISQWLEKYKTGVISSDPIKDYRVDKVTINQANEYKVIAWVNFSIQLVEYSDNWSVMTMGFGDSNDPWDHLAGLFDIYQEGGNVWLKLVPGGGL